MRQPHTKLGTTGRRAITYLAGTILLLTGCTQAAPAAVNAAIGTSSVTTVVQTVTLIEVRTVTLVETVQAAATSTSSTLSAITATTTSTDATSSSATTDLTTSSVAASTTTDTATSSEAPLVAVAGTSSATHAATATPRPEPTATPLPAPTSTPRPVPTATPRPIATATPVPAGPPPVSGTLSPTVAKAGQTITYTVHTSPGASVDVTIIGPGGQSHTTAARTADSSGTVVGTFVIPSQLPAGSYQLVVNATLNGQTSHFTLTATIVR